MFFIISKIVPVLIDPVFVFFCLFVIVGLRCAMSGWGRFVFFLTILFFYCASTPVVVNPLFTRLEGEKSVKQLPKTHYDAAVVLTGMVTLSLSRENSVEFGDGVDRILKGMDMVRHKQADYLVISGGSGELIGPVISESKLLKAFAVRFGIPKEKILIDANSRNTRENALMTKLLLESYNLKKIALITSAFHMPRAIGCFKAVGLAPDPVPVDYQVPPPKKKDFRNYFPKAATLSRFSTLIHELVGIIVYGVRGYAVY